MSTLFVIVWVAWFLSEVFLNRFLRSKSDDSKVTDKNSVKLIWITIFVSISVGITSSFFFFIPIASSHWIELLGMGFIIAGIFIRVVAIYTLGRFFTVNLAIHDNQHLVQSGLYQYIRHPSYTGSLLSFLGLGFALNNWISLLIIWIPIFLAFLNRIKIEEELLLKQPGLNYRDYKRKTWRLIPFIF